MALLARMNASVFMLSNSCFTKLTLNGSRPKVYRRYSKCLSTKRPVIHSRSCHTDVFPKSNDDTKEFVQFEERLKKRRDQARRTILVQVQSIKSCDELYNYCTQFGGIKGMHYYNVKTNNTHFVLVEFENSSHVDSVLSLATHVKVEQVIPVRSTMLYFRVFKSGQKLINHKEGPINFHPPAPNKEKITNLMLAADSISDQMVILHDLSKIDDIGIRLRFQTANQLERCYSGLFPNMIVLPFGSSVNGFGKRDSDLDLVLRLESQKEEKAASRLVFQTKLSLLDDRAQSSMIIGLIADTMKLIVPGVQNVRKILQARVPIVKYDHVFTGLECDLSMSNMTAIHMSELLSLYGDIDWRVRPLVFTIRRWAESVAVTKNMAGPWITNFSLTLLVLFYLQSKKILPTLDTLKKLADKGDLRFVDNYVDCTFLRDIKRLPKEPENTESLQMLLLGFFNFYSDFDFYRNAISLKKGVEVEKADSSPLYICNPLEPSLNVSKNVNQIEAERLTTAMRNGIWLLETSNNDKAHKWGLLSLCQLDQQETSHQMYKQLNVANFFDKPQESNRSIPITTTQKFMRTQKKKRPRRL